ncbi:ABC transporter ATP-binding protein [Streptomyces sp. NPDC086091]|uniref:ABC transporter ATP-binding protein n=1 Tax=Streptomyces sp. NPDC086091 TaxID=3365751 RepID=UPI0038116D08
MKRYRQGTADVAALDGVGVDIRRGRFTAVVGASGSGKSTLMHCLAGLDTVTSGRIVVDGVEITALSDRALTRLRRERIGFVFQAFNLLPQLSALDNITLPLVMAGRRPEAGHVEHLADVLGLDGRLSHRPAELSGGQQQRVAIARALVSRPAVVVADEPTGNLDSRAAAEVLGLLRRSVDEMGQSVVMVTHDPRAAAVADRVVTLADGRIVDDRDAEVGAAEGYGSVAPSVGSAASGGGRVAAADSGLPGGRGRPGAGGLSGGARRGEGDA